MTETALIVEEREADCAALTNEAVNFIIGQLAGTKGTGYRRTSDLEAEIYQWLWNHAIFEDEAEQ